MAETVLEGRTVQTGAEQSLWVHTPLNLGHRVLLALCSVTAGDRGTVPSIILHLICGRLAKAPLRSVLGGKGDLLPRFQFPQQLTPGGFCF